MKIDDLDLLALGSHVLRPDRARAIEVISILAGASTAEVKETLTTRRETGQKIPFSKLWRANRITDPVTALEALSARAVIPADWVSSDERDFLDEKLVPQQKVPTLEHVVALASDVQGILLAEELAREVASRLSRWIDEPTRRLGPVPGSLHWSAAHLTHLKASTAQEGTRKISWRMGVHADGNLRNRRWPTLEQHAFSTRRFTGSEAMSFLTRSIQDRADFGSTSKALRGEVGEDETAAWDLAKSALKCVQKADGARLSQAVAARDVFSEITFRFLARRGVTVPAFPKKLDRHLELVGLRADDLPRRDEQETLDFASFPSPFVPMLHLWNTGYVLEEITPQRITMFSPRGCWSSRPAPAAADVEGG